MISLRRYTANDAEAWDAFVATAKNATVLFMRGYMDYHSDRFNDHSLMFYDNNSLYALLPANISGDTLYSHQGLTYGGILLGEKASTPTTLSLFDALNEYLRNIGVRHVVYKPVPHVYHTLPAEEDLYALYWRCKARVTKRDIGTMLELGNSPRWARLRRRGVKHAQEAGITVREDDNLEAFWKVLEQNLWDCHGVKPVHTVEEMRLLKNRFPDNIRLYNAYLGDAVVGGILLYIYKNVVHAQYSSATPEGKHMGALDIIYDRLLNHDFTDYKYFDWGRSTEGDGHTLNENLIMQKEGFGGRAVIYDTYEYTLS